MSNFFTNFFGGNKSKSKKDKVKEPEVPQYSTQKPEEETNDNIPGLNRRLSLSKSGRMKEKKRLNISVIQPGFGDNTKNANGEHGRKPSLPGSDVFDIEGIEKAAESVEKS